MQFFDRAEEPPPSILRSKQANQSREKMRAFMFSENIKRMQTNVPRSEFDFFDESMRDALNRLFNGKCAFCESRNPVSPHRFRPASEALPMTQTESGHLYYAWLADAWENIYPICEFCRPAEASYFPVRGKRLSIPSEQSINRYLEENLGLWRDYPVNEKPVLLDPCSTINFYQSLMPQIDGKLIGLSESGKTTIENFSLNHPDKTGRRRERYQQYIESLIDALASSKNSSSRNDAKNYFAFPDLEFGGTWYLLLRRLARTIGGEGGINPIVSPSRINRFFMGMYGKRNAEDRIRRGLERLEIEDRRGFKIQERIVNIPSQARVAEIELKNFKAVEAMSIVMPVATEKKHSEESRMPVPSLLILGENAAGKSSILEAIALTLCSEQARERMGLRAESFILDPEFLGQTRKGKARQAKVTVNLTDSRNKILDISSQGFVSGGTIEDEMVPVFAYGAFRHYQHKRRQHAPHKYLRNLFDGSVLSNPQEWLLSLPETSYAMVVRALRAILSIDGDFDILERDLVQKKCFIRTSVADSHGSANISRTPLAIVSSGFRSVLAMACEIMEGLMDSRVYGDFRSLQTARGVVLIDEVEAHLHPRWKMQIMRGLREALPGMTFIVTTHDPLCLRGMNNGEVAVLQKIASKDCETNTDLPLVVEKLVDLPDITNLRIEQLLTSDFFHLFSTDAPEADMQLAKIADLISQKQRGDYLNPSDSDIVEEFETDIASALPIGSSAAHRIVQDAVLDFLVERRTASELRMKSLKPETKEKIVNALRGIY